MLRERKSTKGRSQDPLRRLMINIKPSSIEFQRHEHGIHALRRDADVVRVVLGAAGTGVGE
jgi:hypothetical protein